MTHQTVKRLFSSAAGVIATVITLAGSAQPSHAETDVFSTFKDAGTIASEDPIITLNVPGGNYAIFAKIGLDQDDPDAPVTVVCRLQAGKDFDLDHVRLQRSHQKNVDNAAIPLQVVHAFPGGSNDNKITLSCKFALAESDNLALRFAKITALRVDGLFCNKPSPAAVCP